MNTPLHLSVLCVLLLRRSVSIESGESCFLHVLWYSSTQAVVLGGQEPANPRQQLLHL